jgi:transcriptional regulator with XRE-family HTH domain
MSKSRRKPKELHKSHRSKRNEEQTAADIHVGARLRTGRLMRKMSQEKLGEKLGITFQQIQKYEKGTNRIGGSRLVDICNVLGLPVEFFFDGMPGYSVKPNAALIDPVTASFLASSLGMRMMHAVIALEADGEAKLNKAVLEVLEGAVEMREREKDTDNRLQRSAGALFLRA